MGVEPPSRTPNNKFFTSDHFESVDPPSFHQNPLLQSLDQPNLTGSEAPSVEDSTTDPAVTKFQQLVDSSNSQDPLNRPLQGGQSNENIEGIEPPERIPNNKFFVNSDHFDNLDVPGEKQNPLLRPLKSDSSSDHPNLQPPSLKQDPLLRPLQSNSHGQFEGQDPPSINQDPLLSQLKSKDLSDSLDQNPPSVRQDPLLRNLKGDQKSDFKIDPPTVKQNPLLKKLTPNDEGKFRDQRPPNFKQNPLLHQLRQSHTSQDDKASQF